MKTVSNTPADPVLETQVFWVRYRTHILIALLAVLLGTLGVGAYRFYHARREAAAAELLAKAKDGPEFQKIITDYPGSAAGASASILLATRQRETKQFAEANATLQAFIDRNAKHPLVTTAKMARASNLEALQKPDEALEAYRRLAAEHPRSFNAPLALLAEVPLLKQKGQIEEARRVCETVLTQYRESSLSGEAARHLRTLKAAAPSEASPAPVNQSPASAPAPGTPASSPLASVPPSP